MVRCSFVGVVVALAALSPAWAQEKVALPKGQAPHFCIVTEVNKDGLVIMQFGPTKGEFTMVSKYKPVFKEIDAFDPKGKKLTADEVAKRLKPGSVVLISVDEKPVDPAYLAIVKDDTVILVGGGFRVEGVPIKPKK
jgi:hypothetical protein